MYNSVFPKSFSGDVKAIKKDKLLFSRLKKKVEEILENPLHYEPKKHALKGKRSAHVGSYVILFEIKGNDVIFLKFKHHDYVYQ